MKEFDNIVYLARQGLVGKTQVKEVGREARRAQGRRNGHMARHGGKAWWQGGYEEGKMSTWQGRQKGWRTGEQQRAGQGELLKFFV